MKISFGRIVPVITTPPQSRNAKRKINKSTNELEKILNSETSTTYSDKEAQSVRNFFKEVLGDYNGKDGILIRKTQAGDVFMISGKDTNILQNQRNVDSLIKTQTENNKQKKNKDSQIVLSSEKPNQSRFDKFEYFKTQIYYSAKVDGFIRKDVEQTSYPTCQNRCSNIIVDYNGLSL